MESFGTDAEQRVQSLSGASSSDPPYALQAVFPIFPDEAAILSNQNRKPMEPAIGCVKINQPKAQLPVGMADVALTTRTHGIVAGQSMSGDFRGFRDPTFRILAGFWKRVTWVYKAREGSFLWPALAVLSRSGSSPMGLWPFPTFSQVRFDAPKHLRGRDVQHRSEAQDRPQRGILEAPFQEANVRPMVAAFKSQLLLG